MRIIVFYENKCDWKELFTILALNVLPLHQIPQLKKLSSFEYNS